MTYDILSSRNQINQKYILKEKKMEKWSELMEENREAIVEKMVEAFKEAEGGMSGWQNGVEMDQDGEVWTTGIMSQGSQLESSFNGRTFIVDWIKTWEADYSTDELRDADELKEQYTEYEKTIEDAEKNDEYPEFDSFFDFLNDRYFELYKEVDARIIQDNKEFEISEYREYANDKLDDIIKMQKDSEKYEGEDAQF